MAELVNGTYAIISLSSSLALGIGANKAITLTESDMDSANKNQTWDVFKTEHDITISGEGTARDTWFIKSVKSGKIIAPKDYVSDVSGEDIQQEDLNTERYDEDDATSDEDYITVPVYDDTWDTSWLIVDTGETHVDDDDTYTVYNIRRVLSVYETENQDAQNTMSVAMSVQPGTNTTEPKLITETYDSSSNAQKWIFVPTEFLDENGLYTIRSAVDANMGLIVPSKSKAVGASIKIGSIGFDANHQFRVEQSGRAYRLRPHHSGKAVDIHNNTPKANADIIQYTANRSLYNTGERQFMAVTKGKAKGAVKGYLEYVLTSTSTTFTMTITKMVLYTTFAKGLPYNTKRKVRVQSAPGVTNNIKAGKFAEKNVKAGSAKNKTKINFGLSGFAFTYSRGNSAVRRTVKIRMTIRPSVFLGTTTTNVTTTAGKKNKKIVVDGKTVAAAKNNLTIYANKKYIWDGDSWETTTSTSAVEYVRDVNISFNVPAKSSGGADVTDNSQLWVFEAVTGKKASLEFGGTIYQRYKIRANYRPNNVSYYMDIAGNKAKANSNVQLAASSSKESQQFIIVPTSSAESTMDQPGTIRETNFSVDSDGETAAEIVLENLTFMSAYSAFQARYRTLTYSDTTNYTIGEWCNLSDDSTSNAGWGRPGYPTFEYTPVDGIVRLPFSKPFKLGGDSKAYAYQVQFQIRGFIEESSPYGYPEFGPTRTSRVSLVQNPVLRVESSSVYADLTANDIGIRTNVKDSLSEGCQIIRGRLLGSDGIPISDWLSRSAMTLVHLASQTLYRFPNDGETIAFEYSMLAKNGSYTSGAVNRSFSYEPGVTSTLTYSSDDSERAFVEIDSANYAFCLYTIRDGDQNRLVIAERVAAETGKIRWVLVPPLNTSFDIYVMTSANNAQWTFAKTEGYISSHLFIWNWTSNGSQTKFDEYASIIVNQDAPPQQTRGFLTGLQFSKPMSRRHPVAFSDISLETDLSVEGVVVDDDINYVAAAPLPQHSSPRNLMNLISLSGLGIHPVYRTPYGDWYTTAIEKVDMSKTDLGYSRATITQRAVKDY